MVNIMRLSSVVWTNAEVKGDIKSIILSLLEPDEFEARLGEQKSTYSRTNQATEKETR